MEIHWLRESVNFLDKMIELFECLGRSRKNVAVFTAKHRSLATTTALWSSDHFDDDSISLETIYNQKKNLCSSSLSSCNDQTSRCSTPSLSINKQASLMRRKWQWSLKSIHQHTVGHSISNSEVSRQTLFENRRHVAFSLKAALWSNHFLSFIHNTSSRKFSSKFHERLSALLTSVLFDAIFLRFVTRFL